MRGEARTIGCSVCLRTNRMQRHYRINFFSLKGWTLSLMTRLLFYCSQMLVKPCPESNNGHLKKASHGEGKDWRSKQQNMMICLRSVGRGRPAIRVRQVGRKPVRGAFTLFKFGIYSLCSMATSKPDNWFCWETKDLVRTVSHEYRILVLAGLSSVMP